MEQDRTDSKGSPGQGAKPREILVGPEYLEKSGRLPVFPQPAKRRSRRAERGGIVA